MTLAWQSQEWLPRVIPQGHPTWPWQWRTFGNQTLLSTSLYFSSLLYSARSGKFDALKRNDFYSKKIKTKKITQGICSFWISEQIFQSTIKANWLESQSLHWGYWPSEEIRANEILNAQQGSTGKFWKNQGLGNQNSEESWRICLHIFMVWVLTTREIMDLT